MPCEMSRCWHHLESLKVQCLTCLIVVHAVHATEEAQNWSNGNIKCLYLFSTDIIKRTSLPAFLSFNFQPNSVVFLQIWCLKPPLNPYPEAHLSTRSWISFALVPALKLLRYVAMLEMNECWVMLSNVEYTDCHIIYDNLSWVHWVHPVRIRFCQH